MPRFPLMNIATNSDIARNYHPVAFFAKSANPCNVGRVRWEEVSKVLYRMLRLKQGMKGARVTES
jgi:hypothetical protein